MESCLLCLEINNEFVDCIKVNSTEWQTLDIQNLIEKHFWIMEPFLPTSWICKTCWRVLHDFNQFYVRIEEAHMDFGKLIKKDRKELSTTDENINSDENKDFFVDDALNESYIEPEILIDHLEDQKPIIKEEDQEKNLDEDIPEIQRGKRKRRYKPIIKNTEENIQDPLKKANKSKSSSKRKNIKKTTRAQSKSPIESILKTSETEIAEIKKDPDSFQIPDESKPPTGVDDDVSDFDNFDSHTDVDYKPEQKIKRPKRNTKKQKTTEINFSDSSDSDDCNADSATESEDENTKRLRKISKERDQFLAENFKMSCIICQIPMDDFKTVVKHFKMEHKERGYVICCSKKFYERIKLHEHVRRHVAPNLFKCEKCGKCVKTQKSLQSHQLLHLSAEEKKFRCTECGKSFAKQNILKEHIRRVHLRVCVRICDICGKTLWCRDSFQRHMMQHEGKPLPEISCEICGRRLGTKMGLKQHKIMEHSDDKNQQHICNICHKVSPNSHALRKHIYSTHKAKSNHICTMCGRGFKRPLALREHMATHTGIALYTCPWCPKTFNANAALHTHRRTQHPNEWLESRRQRKLEKYVTPAPVIEANTANNMEYKVDLANFNASISAADLN